MAATDIDQVLSDMRQLRSRWVYPGFEDYERAFKQLAMNFIELDDALSRGHELPRAWQEGRGR